MIRISRDHLSDILSHGRDAYPEECCGAVLGDIDPQNEKLVRKIIPIENNWVESGEESRHRRFAIVAEDYRALEAKAKETKLSLLGFYHTHPDHEAKPSKTDLSYAWPFFSYLILSIKKGKAGEICSYLLDTEKNEFKEEYVKVLD